MLVRGREGGAGRPGGQAALLRTVAGVARVAGLSKTLVVLFSARLKRTRRAATANAPEHVKRADTSITRVVLNGGDVCNSGGRLQQARLTARPPRPASAPLHGFVHARRALVPSSAHACLC